MCDLQKDLFAHRQGAAVLLEGMFPAIPAIFPEGVTAQALEIKHITDVAGEETCIKDLQSQNAEVDIYNAQGAMVQSKANINKAMKTLPSGIYVIKGLKVAVNN